MTTPRVAYVVKRFPRLSETFILRELLELERLGLDVVVCALGHSGEATVHGDYARLRATVLYADDLPDPPAEAGRREERGRHTLSKEARMARRFVPALRGNGVSHLHAHFATSAAEVARHAAAALARPFSVTAHAKDIFHESVSASALNSLVQDAAFIVTVSDYNVGHLRSVCRASRVTPIHRIYNGIDSTTLAPHGTSRLPASILGVGRFVEKKGFDVFVDAVVALRGVRPDVTATLIGTGRCEADLRARIERLGLAGVVTMAGALPQHEVLAAMRQHTVLAVPCVVGPDGDRDGLPTVIIEAMALGLPVVSTPVTGIPEIVRHGETGLMVPERNPFALAEALHGLIAHPPLRQRLARQARLLVEREFDARRSAVTLRDLFLGAVPESVDDARLPLTAEARL